MDILEALGDASCVICLAPLAEEEETASAPTVRAPGTDDCVVSFAPDADPGDAGTDALANIVVLPCGHLLHFLCYSQMAEFRGEAEVVCPVCRTAVKRRDAEPVRLRLRSRPSAAAAAPHRCDSGSGGMSASSSQDAMPDGAPPEKRRRGEAAAADGLERSRSGESPAPRDIVVISERQVAPQQAYCDFLRRITSSAETRLHNLQCRLAPLEHRHQQLDEDVQDLRSSLDAAKSCATLLQGPPGGAGEERSLRRFARKLQFSLGCCTSELAAVMRECDSLEAQLHRYEQRVEEMGQQLRLEAATGRPDENPLGRTVKAARDGGSGTLNRPAVPSSL